MQDCKPSFQLPDRKNRSNRALLLAFTFSSNMVFAAQDCDSEKQNCACQPSEIQFASKSLTPNEHGKLPISLEADDIQADGQKSVTLNGNAEVSQGRQTIVADTATFYRDSERVEASGNVEMISKNGDYFKSQSIDVSAPTHIGQLSGSEFKIARSISTADGVDTVKIAGRGSAKTVNLEGEGMMRLENARFTRCAEGNDDVVISAGELELDNNEGVGVARNALIRFFGVPIFYTPYISFPLNDERKTGLLSPSFGNDDESGDIYEIPWYWNIADNQDATITPRIYSERGVQVAAEYRHKSKRSDTFVYGAMLSGDDLYEGKDRDMFSLRHVNDLTSQLTAKINYNDVSDVDYFDDLTSDIGQFSASYVPRDASLDYSGSYFSAKARYSEYQIIDSEVSKNRKPYERVPEISFRTYLPEGPSGLKYGLDGSVSTFAHDIAVEGTRTALSPYVSLPMTSLWGYVKPKLTVHHRNYSLSNVEKEVVTINEDGTETASITRLDDNPSFTVPVFSLDTGLYFEKISSWFGKTSLQTLEPRLFYVYAPREKDQDDAPLFDTSQGSRNYVGGNFRENRFTGGDRVGDTNQLTLGLSTRITDNETGDQRLSASIGQLYLIDDQEQATRQGSKPIEAGLGDLLAKVSTESEHGLTTLVRAQYDYDESEIVSATLEIGYEPKENIRKRLNLNYYYTSSQGKSTDQLTFKGRWPLADKWTVFGSERYSIEDSESISTTLGLEYNACCWKVRLIGSERMTDYDINNKKSAVFLELEITSLGRVQTGLY